MAKRGRPTDLTPDIQAKIVEVVAAGNYREIAAHAAGISPRTLAGWVAQGKKAKSGIHRDFLQAVLKAEQDAEIRMVKAIVDGAEQDPKHAQWWLERKAPERWGRDRQIIKELLDRVKSLEAERGTTPPDSSPRRKA